MKNSSHLKMDNNRGKHKRQDIGLVLLEQNVMHKFTLRYASHTILATSALHKLHIIIEAPHGGNNIGLVLLEQ